MNKRSALDAADPTKITNTKVLKLQHDQIDMLRKRVGKLT